MELHFKLASIDYDGAIGREWTFNIDAGQDPMSFNTILKSNSTTNENKTVLLTDIDSGGNMEIKVNVDAIERDKKFSDKGNGDDSFSIDTSKVGVEQPFKLSFKVKENRGMNVKSDETAKLTLNFVATIGEADQNCNAPDTVTPNAPIVGHAPGRFDIAEKKKGTLFGLTELTDQELESTDSDAQKRVKLAKYVVIEGCVYKAGNDWKVKPTRAELPIRTGVNMDRIKDAVPKGNVSMPTVTCANVNLLIRDFEYYLSVKDDLASSRPPKDPPSGNKEIQLSYSVQEAHEAVHVASFTMCIPGGWNEIQDEINAYIIGPATLSKADAEKKKDAYLEKKKYDWYVAIGHFFESEINGDELQATQAGVDVATKIRNDLKAFKMANNCP